MEGIFILVVIALFLMAMGDFRFEILKNGRGFELTYRSKLKIPSGDEE